MNNQDDSPPGSDRQWWLTDGTDLCFVCEAHVHPEMLAHCAGCDRAMCFICIGDSDRNRPLLCPDCRSTVSGAET